MIDTVINYQNLLRDVGEYIAKSEFKKEYFINQLGISRASFYNKLKNKSFSIEEMLKLTTLLFPDELKSLEIKEALKRSRLDSLEGRIISHEEVITKARKKVSK